MNKNIKEFATMSANHNQTIALNKLTLAFWSTKSLLMQGLLVIAAVGLPSIAHLVGAPVRLLLPMHWPILLAGLVFGWRGGLLVGLLAPICSFAISGYPLPDILPAMTIELGGYGILTGFLKEKIHLNNFASIAIGLLAGRLVFIAAIFAGFGGATPANSHYFAAAMFPGLIAAVAQIITLPLLADWWIKTANK